MDLNRRWRAAFARALTDSALELNADEASLVAEQWFDASAMLPPEEAAWLYVINRAVERRIQTL